MLWTITKKKIENFIFNLLQHIFHVNMATSEVGGGWEFCIFLLGTWPLISQFKIFYRWFWTKKTGSDSTMFNIAYKLHSHVLLKLYVFTGNVVIETHRRRITCKHTRGQTQSDPWWWLRLLIYLVDFKSTCYCFKYTCSRERKSRNTWPEEMCMNSPHKHLPSPTPPIPPEWI